MPRTLLKVFGGWVVVVVVVGGGGGFRVSLVFTFGPKSQLKFGPLEFQGPTGPLKF